MFKSSISFLVIVSILFVSTFHIAPAAGASESVLQVPDFRSVISAAKDKVFPTVVYIKCIRQGHEEGKKQSREVAGSGVIISADGEVLTNWHVVDKAIEVRCLLYDGRAMHATITGTDKDTDLALLKLKMKKDEKVPFAAIGKSGELKEGDFVMAMGAPLGLNRSVSIGIISCTNRYLPKQSQYSLWLQTDAAISPGNSGGPLVNTAGEVIGINTLGVMFGGDMGFSVPSDTFKYIISQLRKDGKVNWSWCGLQLQPLRDFERDTYFHGKQGVIIAETDPQSPARSAGIMARDRIMALDGKAVYALTSESLPALRRRLGMLEKLKPVEVSLIRNGKEMKVTLMPTGKGEVQGKEQDCPRWDMTVKAINRFENPNLYFHRPKGVFIFGIKYPGNSQASELRRNDIILSIDGKKVSTLDDVKKLHKEALANIKNKSRILFNVLRGGLLRQVVLDFGRDYEQQ
ncbi:MAG: PDZ domain-containing protein [Planctomycetes bacterium]|nr:PDZ domain-containing protein [Planctomycetota bacterium]